MSSEIIAKLSQLVERGNLCLPERYSEFQLSKFVVGSECTVQSQMWQTIRELKSRKESLDALELEIANTKDNIELFEIEIEKRDLEVLEDTPVASPDRVQLFKRENKVKRRKLEREKTACSANLVKLSAKKQGLLEESQILVGIFEQLEAIEPLKSQDDEQVQKEYWNEKLSQKFNLAFLLGQSVSGELAEAILSLPDDAAIKQHLISVFKQKQQHLIEQKRRLQTPQTNGVPRIQKP